MLSIKEIYNTTNYFTSPISYCLQRVIISLNKNIIMVYNPQQVTQFTNIWNQAMRVDKIEGFGRSVMCTQPIKQGQQILIKKPVLCYPTLSYVNKVCYFCLKVLNQQFTSYREEARKSNFCGRSCQEAASQQFLEIENNVDLTELKQYCMENQERFPLMVARQSGTFEIIQISKS
eukprot:TRINITY_DN24993_c0_g1_i1.p2 TRINITY_DN24993_c0_g1~~TRINITY_DN24993_c0_g1_i1.p2  ORF type:complete len:188 (-),score=4.82 TRINITY_DN24993_c0_g1_i1:149-673(-)